MPGTLSTDQLSDPRKLRTITTVAHEPTGPAHSPSPSAAPGDVVEFLRAHPPFDALTPAEVEQVAASAEVEFFRAGSTIFSQGAQPVEHLRVVRTGAVEIVLNDRVLDMLGAGELFGHASMLSGLPLGFAARAQEDTLCYRIPEQVARAVLARPESVGFVARSLLEMTRDGARGACSEKAGARPRKSARGGSDPRSTRAVLTRDDHPRRRSEDDRGRSYLDRDRARRLARHIDRPRPALARGGGRPSL